MILKNKRIDLANGLRILFLEKPDSQAAGLGIAVNAGPYCEDENVVGISHLLEHVVGRASSGKNISLRQNIYENGGLLDAATSVSQTFYFLYTYPEKLTELTKLLIDGVYYLKFSTDDILSSKESVLSELAFNQDYTTYEILRKMMWKDDKLARSIAGTKDSLFGITQRDIENYHKYFYASNNSSVVVIGSSMPDLLLAELEKIPMNKKFKKGKIDLKLKKPGFRIFQERNLHSIIAFAFPTKGYVGLGENRHIFNLATSALNDYFSTKLGEKGLVYEANWNWNIFPENGDLVILLESLADNHVLQALGEGIKLISDWSHIPLTQKKFEQLKSHRILDLKISASLVDALPLFTKNFSSSEEAHTYDEAIGVYEEANLEQTLRTVNSVLLAKSPYTVVDLGQDAMMNLGKISQLLEDYYAITK